MVELPNNDVVSFTYNGNLQRVAKQDTAAHTKYIWDIQSILIETDDLDVTQTVSTLEPGAFTSPDHSTSQPSEADPQHDVGPFGKLVSRHDAVAASSSFYHFDALGSTHQLTDSAEVITDDYVYYAFGELKASSGTTDNPYRRVGRLVYYFDDELERHHLRAREYEATTARFVSKDPLGVDAGDSNLYRYVGNSPISEADPSGHQSASFNPESVPTERVDELVRRGLAHRFRIYNPHAL